jgi:hypothetical protein
MKLKWILLFFLVALIIFVVYRILKLKELWDKSLVTFNLLSFDVGKINLVGNTDLRTRIDFYLDNKTNTNVTIRDVNVKAYYQGTLLLETIKDYNTSKIEIQGNKINTIPVQVIIHLNKVSLKLLFSVLAGNREYIQIETKVSVLGIKIPYTTNYLLDKKDF